ncbi:CLUMA_CG007565, isoform A [Clunio marinus]|uniref:CLUMA_CG007565, isoform A n=1 Tax=Clunio marinus TaxID=568069 RepID=A0A1J1I6K3_9DIPT|nr:CLUMA_CG007565, isoform A [Clunio marinus]
MTINLKLRIGERKKKLLATKRDFWLVEASCKNDEKQKKQEKRCIIYDYFSLLFTDPSLFQCNMQLNLSN